MRFGTWQIVADETKRETPGLEAHAKNTCVRTAWISGQRPTGKPVAAWDLLTPEQVEKLGPPTQLGDWRLRVWVDTEPRPRPEEKTDDDLGFA